MTALLVMLAQISFASCAAYVVSRLVIDWLDHRRARREGRRG